MTMLDLADVSPPAPRPAALMAWWRAGDPVFFGLGLLLLLLMLPTGLAGLVDDRLFNGVNIWDKPLKFEFALGVFALTLALYGHALSIPFRRSRAFRVFRGSVVAAILLEIAAIAGAAALGTASHFNPTPVGELVYAAMGISAVLLTSSTAVFAWGIARNANSGMSPALKASLVLGLGLTLPLTLLTAGTMSAMGGHFIGGAGTDAGGLALLGWARNSGDLRVPHFFGTHAMHAVPGFGLLMERLGAGACRWQVYLFSVAFVLFVLYTFAEALAGRPFLPMLG